MKNNHKPTSVLFEMLCSFASLARTLNLSRTTSELGISRQTIRRHIRELEGMRGEPLFDFHERKYSLTKFGKEALIEADIILQRARYWTSNHSNTANGLYCMSEKLDDGTPFHSQRHRLSDIWHLAPPILIEGFQAWAASGFQIEAPEMESIREYLVVFRKRGTDWICTEVGDKSAIAGWHGPKSAKSAIGTVFEANPLSIGATVRVMDAHDTVARTGGVWYDHISTRQSRQVNGIKYPVSYQRIVFHCEFPDGQPAAASLSARTNRIVIENMPTEDFEPMPKNDLMDTLSSKAGLKMGIAYEAGISGS